MDVGMNAPVPMPYPSPQVPLPSPTIRETFRDLKKTRPPYVDDDPYIPYFRTNEPSDSPFANITESEEALDASPTSWGHRDSSLLWGKVVFLGWLLLSQLFP